VNLTHAGAWGRRSVLIERCDALLAAIFQNMKVAGLQAMNRIPAIGNDNVEKNQIGARPHR
jgi:hypothetical protein